MSEKTLDKNLKRKTFPILLLSQSENFTLMKLRHLLLIKVKKSNRKHIDQPLAEICHHCIVIYAPAQRLLRKVGGVR